MAACPSCGRENPDGFAFCGHCGAPLGAVPGREVRKTVTVLFADVVGSTELGEARDPEQVRAQMGRWFEQARRTIERHGGTVEKFAGDAVMAVFGVPVVHEDDALRAARSADELRDPSLRIGVNTGEVVAGEGETMVTGDAVNVAARLEQAAAPGEVLIGAETRRLVRDAAEVEELEPLELKGKAEAVEAYRLLRVREGAEAIARHLEAQLVGRARELARLRQDFEDAVEARMCRLFTLLGPAGIGKSRLAAEFLRSAEARVVRGRCLHYGEGITYWPLVEILIQLGIDPDELLSLASPAEIALATRKRLETEAAERPLVVVLEDLHWAEPTFLDLVEHVADLSRGVPIFLLCVARPELLELRPGWAGGKLNATSLLLEPLRLEECEQLVDSLGGARDELRARIVSASEGNPLFVEEMLAIVREEGDVAVPPSIHALLQARLDSLGREERAVVERGAVEGQVFHRGVVLELAPDTDVDAQLPALVRKELIRPDTPTFPGDDAYRFRHLLIRDAAYESLPKETRADLHERFALWLEEHVELVEQDEIVGYHLEQAARYREELGREDESLSRRAAERLSAAGRSALGRGDVRAAAGLLERAASLLPAGDELRLRALPDLVGALLGLGRLNEALPHIDELDGSGDERSQASATLLRAWHDVYTGRGSFEAARPAIAKARAKFERLGDDVGVARALFTLGAAEWTACRAGGAAAAFAAALERAERTGDRALLQDLYSNLISAYSHGPVPVSDAEADVTAILGRADSLVAEAAASRVLGRLAAMRGDFEAARDLMRRGRDPLAEAGLELMHAGTSQGAAFVEELAGDTEAAMEIVHAGFERLTSLGEHAYASTNAVRIAGYLCELGRLEEAERWLEKARALSPEADISTLVEADSVEAILCARRGTHADAERLGRRAVEAAESTDFWELRSGVFEALAAVHVAAGRSDEARAAYERALAVYEEKEAAVPAERVRRLIADL